MAAELEAARQAAASAQADFDARLHDGEAERARIEQASKDAGVRAEHAVRDRAALVKELDAARQAAVDAQSAVDARLFASETERARMVRASKDAEARAESAIRERDALAAELNAVRQAAATAQADFDARLTASEAERVRMEEASKTAARANEAIRERDALAAELNAAREAAVTAQADFNARLTASEAERVRMEEASKTAAARADEAIRERDTLAAELNAAGQAPAAAEMGSDARLDAIEADRTRMELAWHDAESRADEAMRQRDEIAKALRLLQLKVAGKKKGPQYKDVELTSLLEAPTLPSEQAVRRATRHRLSSAIDVHIDGDAGELFDLSVGGAQVLCPKQPDVNRLVTLSMKADRNTVSCEGRIVWAWLEPHSHGRKLRYRAGISFTKVDEAAIESFISKQSSKET
jgi:chromosome segregation ATPase